MSLINIFKKLCCSVLLIWLLLGIFASSGYSVGPFTLLVTQLIENPRIFSMTPRVINSNITGIFKFDVYKPNISNMDNIKNIKSLVAAWGNESAVLMDDHSELITHLNRNRLYSKQLENQLNTLIENNNIEDMREYKYVIASFEQEGMSSRPLSIMSTQTRGSTMSLDYAVAEPSNLVSTLKGETGAIENAIKANVGKIIGDVVEEAGGVKFVRSVSGSTEFSVVLRKFGFKAVYSEECPL